MDLKDKIILITGATDGIGRQTAHELASEGAKVIIHGRNKERLLKVVDAIKNETGNSRVFGLTADFCSLAQVRMMANEIKNEFSSIDILINNAGTYSHQRQLTLDGYETQFQVNYLSHFLLTEELLEIIRNVEKSRIINVSSMIHASVINLQNLQGELNYSGSGAYSLSKALNILHAYDLTVRLQESETSVFCMHPGVIETKLLKSAWSGGSPVTEGSANLMYVIRSETLTGSTGLYIENRRPMQSNPITYDKALQLKLRDISFEMINN
jgi:retinol dehydrogenase 14